MTLKSNPKTFHYTAADTVEEKHYRDYSTSLKYF